MSNTQLKREQFLGAKPRRAAEAVLERRPDGSALVKLPVKTRWPFRLPNGSMKSFELDEMGLWVWDKCDGRATLLQMIQRLAQHYGLTVREAEASTTKFMQMLAARRLINFMMPEDKD